MDELVIEVTPELIARAQQRHTGNCPIAMAIRWNDDDFGWVRVDRDEISVSFRSEQLRYTWKTPAGARRFVDAFDLSAELVRPMRFTLKADNAVSIKPMKRSAPMTRRPEVQPRAVTERRSIRAVTGRR